MDKEMEKTIVKSFFTKRLQDRILFELSSAKKRKDFEAEQEVLPSPRFLLKRKQ
ncbi:hypothetical protein QUF81_07790 [Peribacillus simplex]|uniref:Fur-regulated basic protein FbpA n=1 Tax=Peribacillus simplex TaxID=1478 RepID=A0AAW7IDG2_9BACI|nr:hypothetical protein [Peribacillus simplex]MDM5293093.1 hypothetical protein [Peribacillus simplex]MDM5452010.1 hypothetical protein [Peribacillus simplex]